MDDHWADYFAATTNAAERAAFANGQESMRSTIESLEAVIEQLKTEIERLNTT